MNWLARLKKEKAPDPHATKPTKPPELDHGASFVGFVAYPPAPFQKIEGAKAAANDPPPVDPEGDREAFEERAAIMEFDGGLSRFDAEALAANLVSNPPRQSGSPKVKPTPSDPDRCCWPHSEAMNGREIDTFTARLARFTDKGLSLDDAERLADKLVIRDRTSDDRRLCLECAHLQGHGRWRCGNWESADVAPQGPAPELVQTLQRCSGYRHATNNGA